MASADLALQFQRQYAAAIDADFHLTTAQRQAYLTSPIRYAGQPVFDTTEGKPYYLNNTLDAWVAFGSGVSGTTSGNTTVAWSGITGVPSAFTPTEHVHPISGVTGLQSALDGKSGTGHTHTDMVKTVNGQAPDASGNVVVAVSGGSSSVDWGTITNKPTTFTPSTHTHAISDVSGLQTALNSKADTGHTHSQYALTSHTHSDFLKKDETVSSFSLLREGKEYLYSSNRTSGMYVNGEGGSFAKSEMTQDADSSVSAADKNTAFNFGAWVQAEDRTNSSQISADSYFDWTRLYQQSGSQSGNTLYRADMTTETDSTVGYASVKMSAAKLVNFSVIQSTDFEVKPEGLFLNGEPFTAGGGGVSAHTHSISDVTGLQTSLNGKSGTGHTHPEYALTGHTHTQYSLTGHTHPISGITGLQTALDGKSGTGHTHTQYSLTGHTHDQYSLTGHTHPEYALSGHTHPEYPTIDHIHQQYLQKYEFEDVSLSISGITYFDASADNKKVSLFADGYEEGSYSSFEVKGGGLGDDAAVNSYVDSNGNSTHQYIRANVDNAKYWTQANVFKDTAAYTGEIKSEVYIPLDENENPLPMQSEVSFQSYAIGNDSIFIEAASLSVYSSAEKSGIMMIASKTVDGVETSSTLELKPDGLYLNGVLFTNYSGGTGSGGTGSGTTVDWNDIINKPFAFTPEEHVHLINDTISLQDELNGKANVSHTHVWVSGVTDKPTINGVSADTSGNYTIPVGGAESAPITLTDAATVSWNFALSNKANLTLGGNRTLIVTNVPAGGTGILFVKQDATGGRTLSLDPETGYVVNNGEGLINVTTAANSRSIMSFYSPNGVDLYWTYGLNYTNGMFLV